MFVVGVWMFVFCNLYNLIGMIVGWEEFEVIVEVVEWYGGCVFVDEIYVLLWYDGVLFVFYVFVLDVMVVYIVMGMSVLKVWNILGLKMV